MKTLIATKENECNVIRVKVENDEARTPKRRAAARESSARTENLLYPGGFLDSQTGDTQFFGFTQYRSPYYQESQTEDGECQIYSSPSWGDTQDIKEESSSPSLAGSPPSKKIRLRSEKSTPSPGAKHERHYPHPHISQADHTKLGFERVPASLDVPGSSLKVPLRRAEIFNEDRATSFNHKEKEILERLKRSTLEIISLSSDVCRETGQVHMLEALAAKHRQEANELEKKALDAKKTVEAAEHCISSVKKEISDLETELGNLLATRCQLEPQSSGPFIDNTVSAVQDMCAHELDEEYGSLDYPSLHTQIQRAVDSGYEPLIRAPSY